MDFLERLKIEKEELKVKHTKLEVFINSEKFADVSQIQKDLLMIQLSSMYSYLACLNARINDLETVDISGHNEIHNAFNRNLKKQ